MQSQAAGKEGQVKFALYSEYIGSQRHARARRLVAVATTEAEINTLFLVFYCPGLRWRLEDWETGETLDVI